MEYKECDRCFGTGTGYGINNIRPICPKCKGKGKLTCHNVDDIVKIEAIQSMKNSISKIGNKRCWEIIESFANYRTRTAYRRVFFQADGKTPESEIK